ncbi:MAG: chemotaxis protein CheD [Polyangiaceae bacterium]|nr:chemotaxis protein CheD [Polyangiaceae bacterium]
MTGPQRPSPADERPAVARHALALGMMKVVAAPAELYTVVATGYALAVSVSGRHVGGLVHFELDPAEGGPGHRDVAPLPLAKFLAALAALGGDPRQLRYELVGGAHVLGTLTPTQRQLLAARAVARVAAVLERHGARLARSDVGGDVLRTVRVDTAAGTVRVETGVRGRGRPRRAGEVPGAPGQGPLVPAPSLPVGRAAAAGLPVGAPETGGSVFVEMGRLHVAEAPTRLVAVLGSCVAVCVFDRALRIGGLAHVMLPRSPEGANEPAKYADTAVGALSDALGRAGARLQRLEARLVGGCNTLFANEEGLWRIPADNARVARSALGAAGIELASEDTGGRVARKVCLDLASLELTVTMLPRPT